MLESVATPHPLPTLLACLYITVDDMNTIRQERKSCEACRR